MKGNKTIIITSSETQGSRIENWCKDHFPRLPFGKIASLIRKGYIRINAKKCHIGSRISMNDEVSFPSFIGEQLQSISVPTGATPALTARHRKTLEHLLKTLIYRDDHIIVLNKPANLAVQGGSGVTLCVDDLMPHLRFGNIDDPKLVHRIDAATSGLLILARHKESAQILTQLFRDEQVRKEYIAITSGILPRSEDEISIPIIKESNAAPNEPGKVQHALTRYRLLDNRHNKSLVHLFPMTGRKHQLRKHLSLINNPIEGDKRYSYGGQPASSSGTYLYLHAYKMCFSLLGRDLNFTAPIPVHFQEKLSHLGLNMPSEG